METRLAWLVQEGHPFDRFSLIFSKQPPIYKNYLNHEYWETKDNNDIRFDISHQTILIQNIRKLLGFNENFTNPIFIDSPIPIIMSIGDEEGNLVSEDYLKGYKQAMIDMINEKDI